jgi:hypothetical protein
VFTRIFAGLAGLCLAVGIIYMLFVTTFVSCWTCAMTNTDIVVMNTAFTGFLVCAVLTGIAAFFEYR